MAARRQPITPETSLFLDSDSGRPRAVSSSFPRETWKPRQPGSHAQAPHPGTALKIGEDWFEIVGERSTPAGGVVYDLSPWDESFVIRLAEELTPEACRAAAQSYREAQERLAKGAGLRFLAVLTGLLPAEDQERLERDYGVPAMRATFLSALPMAAGSMLAMGIGFAASRGHNFGEWNRVALALWDWVLVLFYFFAESLVRIYAGLSSDTPVGSLLVAGPINVARAFRDAIGDVRRAPPKISRHAFASVSDTVRPWNGPEADLQVLSRLPKEHWTVNRTGVVYQGTCYLLVDRQVLDEGEERYRFLLQVPEHEVLYQNIVEFDPTEVREIYREQQRREAATWVETFRMFWGLLDHDRQERLAVTYDYDPKRMTKLSIIVSALVGALALLQGFERLRRYGNVVDAVELFVGGAILWECAVRYKHWQARRWRQSALGSFLRPFADRVLRWEPPPAATTDVAAAAGSPDYSLTASQKSTV